jgi:hypothetical protein
MTYPLLPYVLGEDWPIMGSVRIERQNNKIPFQPDDGPPMERLRYSGIWSSMNFRVLYTDFQVDVLETFYDVTLGGGISYFTRINPRKKDLGVFKFLNFPPLSDASVIGHWYADISIMTKAAS